MAHWDVFWDGLARLKEAMYASRGSSGFLHSQGKLRRADGLIWAAEDVCFDGVHLQFLSELTLEDLAEWERSYGSARREGLMPFHRSEGAALVETLYRFLPETSSPELVLGAQWLIGEYLLDVGAYRDAWGPLEDVLQAAVFRMDREFELSCRILLARCLLAEGDPDAAGEELAQAHQLGVFLARR